MSEPLTWQKVLKAVHRAGPQQKTIRIKVSLYTMWNNLVDMGLTPDEADAAIKEMYARGELENGDSQRQNSEGPKDAGTSKGGPD